MRLVYLDIAADSRAWRPGPRRTDEKLIAAVQAQIDLAEMVGAFNRGPGGARGDLEGIVRQALELVQSGAKVELDKWMASGGGAGEENRGHLTYYLTEPKIAASSDVITGSQGYCVTSLLYALRGRLGFFGGGDADIDGFFRDLRAGRLRG